MKNSVQFRFFLLILVGFFLPASAIVVGDYSVATNPPTGSWDVNWDYVYNYKQSSSVAVGGHWILTAAHVADDGFVSDITIGSITYYQQEVIFHTSADLALVRFDKDFSGYYPLYTGSFSVGDDIAMIGYGNTGTVSSASYLDSGSGSGTKRWGSNEFSQDYTAGDSVGFLMGFNDGATINEAGVGVWDSGGGSFVEDGGVWKLAGINTSRNSTPPYTVTFTVSVPEYATWITQTIAAEDGDDDIDGIPNWWEEQYGSTTGVVASVDQDGDGVIGTDEYIADTDPTDSNAVWQASGDLSLTNQTFTFDGSTARQYQLLYTTNDLADPSLTWISNGVPVWGTGAGTEISVTNTEDTVFYRVWVTLP